MEEKNYKLTVLMPCLNEAATLKTCIGKALTCMQENRIDGEIVIADNGSTDGSQDIVRSFGKENVRVVNVKEKGYGSALLGGIRAARGKYIIMGDADDSYDFLSLRPFVEKLDAGYDLVMGNRFKGGIAPGAMPPLHRYLGNPVLSKIGQILYGIRVGDFHCGLRGFRKEAIGSLHLITTGMEFASEMVVKAALHGLKMTEIPTTLSPDGRDRPPHLRSWSDGWRHLKFLLVYSPDWLFLYPGLFLSLIGLIGLILLAAGPLHIQQVTFDIHTMLYAAIALILGCQIVEFALFTKSYATKTGMLPPKKDRLNHFLEKFTLEKGLVSGFLCVLIGLAGSVAAVIMWQQTSFGTLMPSHTMRLTIPAATLTVLGIQFIYMSFFLHILNIKHH